MNQIQKIIWTAYRVLLPVLIVVDSEFGEIAGSFLVFGTPVAIVLHFCGEIINS